jgi:hypothetical protein
VLSSADGVAWTPELSLEVAQTAGLGGIATRGFWIVRPNGNILRSNGRSWQTVTPPAELSLSRAFGSSESDVWGMQSDPSGRQLRHWDGTSWSAVELPAPVAVPSLFLQGWSNGPGDAWLLSNDGFSTRVFHWDGVAWSPQAEMADAILYSLWGGAPGDLWVAGHRVSESRRRALIRHWNGTAWTDAYQGPDFALGDNAGYAWVTGSPSGELWAITTELISGATPEQLLHWNGLIFEKVVTPNWNWNRSVVASGPDDVWLFGSSIEALHFDGRGWTASSPLQLVSGPDGPLQAGVPGFGAVYMGYFGAVYVNRR